MIKHHDPAHPRNDLEDIVRTFTTHARARIRTAFAGIAHNHDQTDYAFAQTLLDKARHPHLRMQSFK